jgi:UTP:GlnB (protein PII) uridylyltransferase
MERVESQAAGRFIQMTLRALGGEMPTKDRELRNRQEDALKALRLAGLPHDAHQEFWKQLDVAYFLRHDANDIAWQTRVLHDKTGLKRQSLNAVWHQLAKVCR